MNYKVTVDLKNMAEGGIDTHTFDIVDVGNEVDALNVVLNSMYDNEICVLSIVSVEEYDG